MWSVVSCPSLYYQIPIAIHFLNHIMILDCEDNIQWHWYNTQQIICHLCKNQTCIIIPSNSHPGTQKISENCQTIKTREQASQYSFRMQQHNKCHPIIIYANSSFQHCRKCTRANKFTCHEFGCTFNWVSQLIHPNPAVLQYWVMLLCLKRKDVVVSSQQMLVPGKWLNWFC